MLLELYIIGCLDLVLKVEHATSILGQGESLLQQHCSPSGLEPRESILQVEENLMTLM